MDGWVNSLHILNIEPIKLTNTKELSHQTYEPLLKKKLQKFINITKNMNLKTFLYQTNPLT